MDTANSPPTYGGRCNHFQDGFLKLDSAQDARWTQCDSPCLGIPSKGYEKLALLAYRLGKTESETGSDENRCEKGGTLRIGSWRKTTKPKKVRKNKAPRRAKCYKAGPFSTVRAKNPTNGPVIARELRGIVNSDSPAHREAALGNCAKSDDARTWIRNPACTRGWICVFGNLPRLLPDRIHLRHHVSGRCRRSLNPSGGRKRALFRKNGDPVHLSIGTDGRRSRSDYLEVASAVFAKITLFS